ncbi:hypothetical protein Tco_0049189 [Tanacetum coccineum]
MKEKRQLIFCPRYPSLTVKRKSMTNADRSRRVRGTPSKTSYSPGNGNHESSDIPRLATSGKPNKGNLRNKTVVNQNLLAEGKNRTKGI